MKDRVVMVTGAGEGMGRAMVRLFAGEGARVVALDNRKAPLQALVKEIGDAFVLPVTADVSKPIDVERAVQMALDRWGRIDDLVNNAGVGRYGLITELTHEDWQLQIDVNLTGVFNCCKAVLPHMLERAAAGGNRPAGQILNMASEVGLIGVAKRTAYCASKWGVRGLSESLRLEVQDKGIRVMVLNPGMVQTNFAGRPASGKEGFLKPETVACQVYQMLTAPPDALLSSVVMLSQNMYIP